MYRPPSFQGGIYAMQIGEVSGRPMNGGSGLASRHIDCCTANNAQNPPRFREKFLPGIACRQGDRCHDRSLEPVDPRGMTGRFEIGQRRFQFAPYHVQHILRMVVVTLKAMHKKVYRYHQSPSFVGVPLAEGDQITDEDIIARNW